MPQHVQPQEDAFLSLRCCCCYDAQVGGYLRGGFEGEGSLKGMSPLCPGGTAEGVVDGGVRSRANSHGATSQPGFAAEWEV